jgi:uncharacterized membrane protein
MSWLFFAFCGPVLWAISVHFDKYLVERYFKQSNVAVLLIFTALTGLVMLPVILAFRPDVVAINAASMAVIICSGVLGMSALFMYLRALQTEEASVVAPFFQASPLFAYALGYLVLGETLTSTQIAGGVLIISGGLVLSVRLSGARFKLRMVALMLGCTFMAALSSLIFKIFAVSGDFWTTVFWSSVGQVAFGTAVLSMSGYRKAFLQLLHDNTAPLLAINGMNELVNLGGGLSARYALVLAPLSLVQAVTGTTSLFVFLFGIVLSIVAPKVGREDLSPHELVKKGLGGLLIVTGVVLISHH